MKKALVFFMLWSATPLLVFGQQEVLADIKVNLANDTLHIVNKHVNFTYSWNNGNIVLKEIRHTGTDQKLSLWDNKTPNLYLPEEGSIAANAKIEIFEKRTFPNEHWHKQVVVSFTWGSLEVKHIIRIYENAAAISHTYFLRGKAKALSWITDNETGLAMIEKKAENENREPERISHIPFDQKHWKINTISFKEATDHHDNLVFEKKILPYRKKENHKGNILIATHKRKSLGFFLIKEAPITYSQQYYNGYDFQVDEKGIAICGIGLSPNDLTNEWTQGYGYAIGVAKSNKPDLQKALLTYQKQLRKYIPKRDGMILANTWGDRSKDSRMNESFILKEIERASQIGITHLQLDDGWQTGLSRNSASKAGEKWDDWRTEDWKPHPKRFPNGFGNILSTAKKKNIEICLWFNPSKANSYKLWQRDADILIDYYRNHGIKVFKIDGISFADKQSETNLRKLFTKVMEETEGRVTFNMDVTAGRRVGYHYFNEFGNVFLENRYTDWGNYYPHRTLRNLWQLSGYVPTERLQIEFLNNGRNPKKYAGNDVLAPGKIPLDYTSAITLAAQPLAWMEVSKLGDSKPLKEQFTAYKEIRNNLHESIILPFGNEPSGFSWTGFVSYVENKPSYILLFRENTANDHFKAELLGLSPQSLFKLILGNPISIKNAVDQERTIEVSSKKPFTYSLFAID